MYYIQSLNLHLLCFLSKITKSSFLLKIMASDWANLPKHLLDLILERLVSPSDYLRLNIVCMQWHRTTKDNKCQHAKLANINAAPLLLICNKKKGAWNLYDVLHNKVLDWELRLPNKRMCGSSKGWLILMDKNFVVTLMNPFFRVKGRKERENSIIRLPPLEPPFHRKFWSKKCDQYVYKATISEDPILNANDCIVVIIYKEYCQLAFIRLNKDKKWTFADKSVDNSWRLIQEVAQVEGKFCVVDGWSKLFSFDITTQFISDVKVISSGIEPQHEGYNIKRYLVDSNDKELLMVHRYFLYEGRRIRSRKRVTKKFIVFKFNFDKCEWVEKTTLGGLALFVGDNSSISVVASNVSECESNCIYFTHDEDRIKRNFGRCGPHDFGVYNVANQSFSRPYSSDAKTLVKKTTRPLIWVVPTITL